MSKQKRDRSVPSSKRYITVVDPSNGTNVQTYREVLRSSRGGRYVLYCGLYHKVDKSGIQIKLFNKEARKTLP